MVSSKESFSSLDISGGPLIHMGDDFQTPFFCKGSVQFDHGVFKNFLYVPSLATNLLYVYQMTYIGSPKLVVFDTISKEISDISTGKFMVKGVGNHASKAYELAHFLPYSDSMQSQLHLKRNVKPFYLDLLHMIMFPLMFRIQNLNHRTKLN